MEETQVAPDAATLNNAPVLAETPEVAAPESNAETQPDESPKPEEDLRDKAVKNLQRRVDRVTAARYQEQARAQQLAQEAEQLRQRLSQYEQPPQQQALTPDKVLPYAQQLAAQIREQERIQESVSTVLTKGKTLEGFTDACNTVDAELPFYANGKPTDFLRVVLESEAPEKVLHYLGQNPHVLSDLADLSPTQVARRIDRIERDLAKPPEPKATEAPKPIAPVKAATRDYGGLHDELSTEEWIKRRNKQARG